MCVFKNFLKYTSRGKDRRCLSISKKANNFLTEREKVPFLFVVLSVVLVEIVST